jgi:hypothetical protein
MWKYNNKVIKPGRAWSDDSGVQHPANWMRWSEELKTAKGLTKVADPIHYDKRFYDSAGKMLTLKELQEKHADQCKATAKGLLAETDWYVIRKADVGTAIPDEIVAVRAAIRKACDDIDLLLMSVNDTSAFIKLFKVPLDIEGNPIGKAPIDKWPEEEEAS